MEEKNVTTIGSYEAVEMLRKAPEGALYKAVEKDSGSPVLLKLYYPSLVWSEDALNEFFNLVSYLRFIEHDNLLPILDVGKYDGLPYLVFPGNSTSLLTDRNTPAAGRRELLAFFYKIADALDFLHKQEILHGALNTGNILIDAEGEPKLFDYGLSGVFKKLLLENLEDGFDNLSVSDLRCTSPEQILGRNPTRSSDIYSFGMVFYYHAIGEFPFQGKSDPETAVLLLESEAVETGEVPDHVSGDILRFIQKCIQLEPGARFASFPQILNVLERMQAGKWVRLRFKKRFKTKKNLPRRAVWYALGILGLVGLFSVFYFYPRNTEVPPPPPPTIAATSRSFSTAPASQSMNTSAPPVNEQATQASNDPQIVPTEPTQVRTSDKPTVEFERPGALPAEIISPDNIGKIREFARLGFGKPEEADASPDNRYIAVATSAGVVIFEGNRFEKWIDPQDWATSVQFSTNGDLLAIGVNSGDIQLWDWKNETINTTLQGHKGKISRIIFSSSDRLLYSASHDQHVIVWDLNQKSIIKDIPAHSAPVNDIAVSSDGRTLVSCAEDQLIRIWDVASLAKIELRFEGKPKAVAISSDDAYFAAGGDRGYIRQWNLINPQSLTNTLPQFRTDAIPVQEKIWSLDYIDNDTKLLAGIDNGNAKTYIAAQKEYGGVSLGFVIQPTPKDLVDIFGPKFEFDSHSTSYGESIISLRWDGRITVQQVEIIPPMYDILDRLDFSPDGTLLAAGGKRPTTKVWNLKTNQEMYRSYYALPFGDPIAPDGSSMIVLVSETARITLTGEHIVDETYRQVTLSGVSVAGDLSQAITGGTVDYARDGSVLISGSLSASKTWDYESGFETFSTGRSSVPGCFITTSNNNDEVLRINSTAGTLPTLDERARYICAKSVGTNLPAFSSDLTLLAYVNSSGFIEGFDTDSKQSRWRYRPGGRVTALAVSPDGAIVAAGTESGTVIFINGGNGEVLTEIVGNFGSIRALKFSEDGVELAASGDDGTTRLFGIAHVR